MNRRGALVLATQLAGCVAAEPPRTLPETPAACTPQPFVEVTGPAWEAQLEGSPAQPTGWGIVVADLDGDGHLEIFLPQPGQDELYRYEADGSLTDITAEPRAADHTPRLPVALTDARGGAAADYDGDGALDLYVTNHGPDVLLHNDGVGWFVDVTAAAGITPEEAASTSAAWADMDGDGDLDLVVAHTAIGDDPDTKEVISGTNTLWENLGDGTFQDVSERLVGDAAGSVAYVVGWVDIDADGDPDLYAANDKGHQGHANALLRNDGSGRYTDISAESGAGVSMEGMGLAAGDINGDGWADLLVSDWGRLWLFESDAAGGAWFDSSLARGLEPDLAAGSVVAWGPAWIDLDLDGDLDAFVAFGPDDTSSGVSRGEDGLEGGPEEPDGVYTQAADGSFTGSAAAWGLDDPGVGRGFVFADLDGDGAPDLVRRDLWGRSSILLNPCAGDSALVVELAGPSPNRFGIGAVVRVTDELGWSASRWITAGGSSIGSAGPPVAYFGVGGRADVARVEVTWPDGTVTEARDVPAGSHLRMAYP